MKQEKLTEGCKSILIALSGNNYKSSVPEDDVRDFLILQEKGFASSVVAKDKDGTTYLAPKITPRGLAYLAEYPDLSNPRKRVDWKWVVTTVIALGMLVFAALTFLNNCK
jgi:hypothetical protein